MAENGILDNIQTEETADTPVAWKSFISNKAVSFQLNFLLSFDISLQNSDTLLLGVHGTTKPSTQSSVSSFVQSVQRSIVVSNNISMLSLGGIYEKIGEYITKKQMDNSEFFGLRLIVQDNGKVYEEVLDVASYDRSNTDYIALKNTLYTYIDGKYKVLDDGRVALNAEEHPISILYYFKNGNIISQHYYTDNTFRPEEGETQKIRFMVSNSGRILTLSERKDGEYEQIKSYLANQTLASGYILLAYESAGELVQNLSFNGQYKS